MFQIDLAATGNLQLHLPNRCAVEIPATAGGLEYIKKIISDHHRGLKNQRGYIGTLPTQHAVDKAFADNFLKQKAKKTAEARAVELKEKLDIDWDRLEINI
jgi:hypothetical protein